MTAENGTSQAMRQSQRMQSGLFREIHEHFKGIAVNGPFSGVVNFPSRPFISMTEQFGQRGHDSKKA
ncbi:hypothetical protein [Streptomyces sp. RG80]|uniref:hypothetical protein n=1 Tax=Streptomyces sp. RG80 TaxID=3157340 RepID=UPI00338D73C6